MYDNRSADEQIATARGFKSAAEMRSYFERNGFPGQKRMSEDELHARDLEIAKSIQALKDVPTARSQALTAELATAKTRSERRDAVRRFEAAQRTPREARFSSWLRAREHSWAFEDRAASEGTPTAGGNLVPPGFNKSIVHYMRDFDSLYGSFEVWDSDDFGSTVVRPVYTQFSAASTDTENAVIAEGPEPVIAQQSWPLCPTYAATYTASFQLVDDAGIDFDRWVASALGESLGRAIAPVAATGMYNVINAQGAASDSGGYLALTAATPVTFGTGAATTELAAKTISIDTAGQLCGLIDEAYLPNCSWYMSRAQWSGVLRQVDSSKRNQVNVSAEEKTLFGYPVVLSASLSSAAASTVSGPVFGDLQAAMTLRIVKGSMALLRSHEKFAEYAQMYFRLAARMDVAGRDARALVGVKYAAT
jgi:HK97 family phage major capsid protein